MGANDKVAATFHGPAGGPQRVPETPEELARAINGRHATLTVAEAGVHLPVIVHAVASRDAVDVIVPGVATVDCRLSGRPEVSAPAVDRRQRAREAFWDASDGLMSGATDGVEACVETATRVRITPELVHASRPNAFVTDAETRNVIEAALITLGFEVEQ